MTPKVSLLNYFLYHRTTSATTTTPPPQHHCTTSATTTALADLEDWMADLRTCSLTLRSKLTVVEQIKSKLSPRRLEIFRQTVFGHWLLMEYYSYDPLLMHTVLRMEIFLENDVEHNMFFEVVGHVLRFGREEFCLVTALRFGDLPSLPERQT
ncbi:hypothetical protein L6452_00774 [Arctium lappa]|uniref:Uncharacterized protein n=1 Tax=Arctium lappa TaxID=4217 RepID=A0ACB9FEV8_ARCLA|nr:hypothetical protein L6452_00774 [Arctium lappa]